MSAPIASAAASSSSPASQPARATVAVVPRTATARAAAAAAAGIRPSWSTTLRDTLPGVSPFSRGTSVSVPVTPSAVRLLSSARSSSGLPPVRSAQAARNAAEGAWPSAPRSSAAQAPRPSAAGPEHGDASLLGQPGDHCLVLCGPGPGLAHGKHQQHREPIQPAGQVRDEPQRRLIGPVQVIDRQQQRRLLRDTHGQPVQAVQHRERVLFAPGTEGQCGAGQPGRVAR